jgi:hypothetical protein
MCLYIAGLWTDTWGGQKKLPEMRSGHIREAWPHYMTQETRVDVSLTVASNSFVNKSILKEKTGVGRLVANSRRSDGCNRNKHSRYCLTLKQEYELICWTRQLHPSHQTGPSWSLYIIRWGRDIYLVQTSSNNRIINPLTKYGPYMLTGRSQLH